MWWLMLFNAWGLASLCWSLNPTYTMDYLKTAIVQMAIFIPLSFLIRTEQDIYEILKLLVIASVITSTYLLFNIDEADIGVLAIGGETAGEAWNANTIGMMTSISLLSCFALIKRGVSKKQAIFYVGAISLLGYVSLFTGSRKTLFILMAGIALYYLLMAKKNKMVVLSSIIALVFFFYSLVMSVPELYSVLGVRVEGLVAQITGEGTVDYSTIQRMYMIGSGMYWFAQNPIMGYGMNNYRELFGGVAGGTTTYAHNNYVELLVGVGIIGTVIYYYMYFYVIKKLVKRLRYKEATSALFLTLFLLFMVLEYGLVSYNSFLVQLIICLGYKASRMVKEKEIIVCTNY
jgi:O-antigen ligase